MAVVGGRVRWQAAEGVCCMREWSSRIGSLGTGLEWHRIEISARSTLSLIHVAAAVSVSTARVASGSWISEAAA